MAQEIGAVARANGMDADSMGTITIPVHFHARLRALSTPRQRERFEQIKRGRP